MIIMSQAQTKSNNQESYPFHTAVVEGREVCGILFVGSKGRFYEFQDPETHDRMEKYTCPRNGDTISYDSTFNRIMGMMVGGSVRSLVNADKWAEFRTDYLEADEESVERAERAMSRLLKK